MARVAGVNIPDNKKILYSLQYIFGVGHTLAKKILETANVDPEKRVKDLTEVDLDRIREVIDKNYQVEGELRRELQNNIRRLKDINSYRGDRHRRNLPVRGQRTKTNARTKRGKKVTVGSGRKKSAEKT